MLAENMLTWESYDKNRISNMAAMEGPLTSGEHHVAVYYLFPSQASGVEVEMVIKSAYRKVLNFDNIKRRFNVVQLTKKCYYDQMKVPK